MINPSLSGVILSGLRKNQRMKNDSRKKKRETNLNPPR
jgi:hypothetical protein